MSMTELRIETLHVKKASLIFRAIDNKLRQQMLQILHKNERMTVTEIYSKLRLRQPVASHHLGILRRVNLVTARRDRQYVCYSVNYERLVEIYVGASALLDYVETNEIKPIDNRGTKSSANENGGSPPVKSILRIEY